MTMSGPRLQSDRPLTLAIHAVNDTRRDRPIDVNQSGTDTCAPAITASRICAWSKAKSTLPLDRLAALGVLGGVYIGLGAALATLITSDSSLGVGPTRWLGGIAFSLGLLLVVVGGAELSTGNCLMTMARLRGELANHDLWRNWCISFGANALGALVLAWVIALSGILDVDPLRANAIRIAETKLALS